LSLGMPMWMRDQSPFVCASGDNDAEMVQAITTLEEKVGDTRAVYIRLGWEFNADWYPTQTSQGDASYQQAWRDCWVRWYDAIKSVSPKYRVVWNPNWANRGACQSGYGSVLDLWPGAEFVDAAGPDQYDSIWPPR
jgi:cell wall assembly regulator SMI1